jgi:hypothetical protein
MSLITSTNGDRWRIERSDCVAWLNAQPADSVDLIFGSPPYEDARAYLEDGKDLRIALNTSDWVAWMVEVYRAARRVCKGLVAFVVGGRTRDYRWSASPALLMARLDQVGFCLRHPPIYQRVGIPGSGGPDWLRSDYEHVVCTSRPGRLPWSDPTACGHPPKFAPGGEPSHRVQDGSRVNRPGYATRGSCGGDVQTVVKYQPPKLANPGNVIACKVGGGHMGHPLAHENEAPFSLSLAEFFVQSFCPPGGIVADPFLGSGTTIHAALKHNRRGIGCDLRQSQIELARRRLANSAPDA